MSKSIKLDAILKARWDNVRQGETIKELGITCNKSTLQKAYEALGISLRGRAATLTIPNMLKRVRAEVARRQKVMTMPRQDQIRRNKRNNVPPRTAERHASNDPEVRAKTKETILRKLSEASANDLSKRLKVSATPHDSFRARLAESALRNLSEVLSLLTRYEREDAKLAKARSAALKEREALCITTEKDDNLREQDAQRLESMTKQNEADRWQKWANAEKKARKDATASGRPTKETPKVTAPAPKPAPKPAKVAPATKVTAPATKPAAPAPMDVEDDATSQALTCDDCGGATTHSKFRYCMPCHVKRKRSGRKKRKAPSSSATQNPRPPQIPKKEPAPAPGVFVYAPELVDLRAKHSQIKNKKEALDKTDAALKGQSREAYAEAAGARAKAGAIILIQEDKRCRFKIKNLIEEKSKQTAKLKAAHEKQIKNFDGNKKAELERIIADFNDKAAGEKRKIQTTQRNEMQSLITQLESKKEKLDDERCTIDKKIKLVVSNAAIDAGAEYDIKVVNTASALEAMKPELEKIGKRLAELEATEAERKAAYDAEAKERRAMARARRAVAKAVVEAETELDGDYTRSKFIAICKEMGVSEEMLAEHDAEVYAQLQ